MYRDFIIYDTLCVRGTKIQNTHSLSKEIMLKILTGKNEGRSPEVTLCWRIVPLLMESCSTDMVFLCLLVSFLIFNICKPIPVNLNL